MIFSKERKETKPITLSDLRSLELDLEREQGNLVYAERRIAELQADIPKTQKKIADISAELSEKIARFKQQP